jgi:predicted dehydrogenase/threonine dehydrogenase-like Zn-dependent dehydrogenase
MKQVLQNMRSGKTSVEDVPIPTPRAGMALIRTCASLVSAGTERSVVEFAEKSLLGKARSRPDLVRQVLDKARREGLPGTLEAAFNRLDEPLALGYSSAGVIEALGADMSGFQVGQRVACAGGNYAVHAEYALVPRNLLAPLPDGVDFESASFATLAAIALHGFRLAQPQVGENVVVIGLGLLGLLTVQIALAAGCRVLGVDINPGRIELAKRAGTVAVLRPQAEEAALAFSSGRGADAILICAGDPTSDTVSLAGVLARDQGKVVAVGVVGQDLPRPIYFHKELSFVTSRSYGPGRYDPAYEEGGADYPFGYVRWTEGRNLGACVELIASGKLDVHALISHRFPIEQAVEAYDLITGKKDEPFLGVMLTYPQAGKPDVDSRIVCTPSKPAPQATVKLGVLGAGLFANAVLLPAIKKQKDLRLVGIASAGGLHARHSGGKFGFGYAASKDDELINDPNINTLAILTRHDSHTALTIKALKAGKHVFVEKPLAVDPAQLDELEALLNTVGDGLPLLMTGFNRRFAPLAQKLGAFMAGRHEPLLAHYRVNAGMLPLTHWQHDPVQGGGRIIGEGCHFIDFLTFLVGEPPCTVTTQGLPDSGRYREDVLSMTFSFPDGSLGVVDYLANGDKAFAKERLEVFCAGRVAVLDDFRSLEMVQNGHRKLVKSALRQDKGHFNEWQAFMAAIRAGGPPPIPYAHLLGVTRTSFAAIQSLRTNQKIDIL